MLVVQWTLKLVHCKSASAYSAWSMVRRPRGGPVMTSRCNNCIRTEVSHTFGEIYMYVPIASNACQDKKNIYCRSQCHRATIKNLKVAGPVNITNSHWCNLSYFECIINCLWDMYLVPTIPTHLHIPKKHYHSRQT